MADFYSTKISSILITLELITVINSVEVEHLYFNNLPNIFQTFNFTIPFFFAQQIYSFVLVQPQTSSEIIKLHTSNK